MAHDPDIQLHGLPLVKLRRLDFFSISKIFRFVSEFEFQPNFQFIHRLKH